MQEKEVLIVFQVKISQFMKKGNGMVSGRKTETCESKVSRKPVFVTVQHSYQMLYIEPSQSSVVRSRVLEDGGL